MTVAEDGAPFFHLDFSSYGRVGRAILRPEFDRDE
jgi:hypothetical protein